jgi:hypothetical protein
MAGNSLVDARLAPVVVLLLGFLSNPSLSAQVATGSIVGTVESGRGILYGPGHTNFDTSLSKRFSVGGRANAEFRWDVFNLFNHPGFGFPTPRSAMPRWDGSRRPSWTTGACSSP